MSTKTRKHHLVDFYVTSKRLAQAFQNAIRMNGSLGKLAVLHRLDKISDKAVLGGHAKRERVVLSYINEDQDTLHGQRLKHLSPRPFHMLFTDPATHSDQIAQWTVTANIRSANRLLVVRLNDLDTSPFAQLLGRVCFALEPHGQRGNIIDAYLAGDSLFVRGPKYRLLQVPISSIPALKGQTADATRNFEIDPDGSFLYWPDLDVHLGWEQFLQVVDPEMVQKARQKTDGFNKRYGAAIRKVRKAAGLSQARIEGLTDRQVRRIEEGNCRATKSALDKLASAHGMDTTSYMEHLAEALT